MSAASRSYGRGTRPRTGRLDEPTRKRRVQGKPAPDRQSKRFRGPLLLRGRCPLTCIAAVTASGSVMGPFTVLGRASLCSLALIAARFLRAGGPGQGARSARAAAPQAPLTRPPGSGSWPAGARERTAGVGSFGGGLAWAFLAGGPGGPAPWRDGGGEGQPG